MVQPHEAFGWQMTAYSALLMLRRARQASRSETRSLLEVLDSGAAIPPELHPLCKKLYLMQLAPASASLH